MQTKARYPYIYFFLQPNVVFVYKIETDHYVTTSNLRENTECLTYELEEGEDFSTFDHEKRQRLVGRGYAIRLDNKNRMVEQINQQIHKHRSEAVSGPVHIVVSESIAGSLRYGLDRPKTVIGFEGFFEIGPVWHLGQKEGRHCRQEWLNDNINIFMMDDYEYENKFANTLFEIEDISEEAPIYLWAANNGNEQTGLRFIIHLLKERTNEIHLIKVNTHHTAELHPDELKEMFEKNKDAAPLSLTERNQFVNEWHVLAESKGVLRLWKNGQVEEVPEEYFDELILNTIGKLEQKQHDFIRTGMVIGDLIGELDEKVNDAFLEYRVRHLVYSGVLAMKGIPKSMRHYRVKLK